MPRQGHSEAHTARHSAASLLDWDRHHHVQSSDSPWKTSALASMQYSGLGSSCWRSIALYSTPHAESMPQLSSTDVTCWKISSARRTRLVPLPASCTGVRVHRHMRLVPARSGCAPMPPASHWRMSYRLCSSTPALYTARQRLPAPRTTTNTPDRLPSSAICSRRRKVRAQTMSAPRFLLRCCASSSSTACARMAARPGHVATAISPCTRHRGQQRTSVWNRIMMVVQRERGARRQLRAPGRLSVLAAHTFPPSHIPHSYDIHTCQHSACSLAHSAPTALHILRNAVQFILRGTSQRVFSPPSFWLGVNESVALSRTRMHSSLSRMRLSRCSPSCGGSKPK